MTRDVSATRTLQPSELPRSSERELVLVVVFEGTRRDLPLPARGEVTLGRAEECEIMIPHPSLSRRHVTLTIGDGITLTETGSKNGTRLRGEPLDPHRPTALTPGGATSPGDVFEPGALVCFVQVREPASRAGPSRGDGTVPPVVVDPRMKQIHETLARIAAGDISVLLLGETGVGKEVAARNLHARSRRASGPFIALSCASLSSSLLESELFGHEKGAFPGADRAKEGLFEAARGGTVLLDEVGDLPIGVQAKLLRVLEESAVTRLGSTRAIRIDVRVVSATNRDLGRAVKDGAFRSDLFFRLNGATVELPPLRERRTEILPLAEALLGRAAERLYRSRPTLSPAARTALESRDWPGNIRELRNVLERAMLVANGPTIDLEHLGLSDRALGGLPEKPATAAPLRAELDALERQRILDALAQAGGNQTQAAKLLRMPRRTFILRLETYGVPRPRKR